MPALANYAAGMEGDDTGNNKSECYRRAESLRGLGSVSSEQTDSRTLLTVSAGLHWSFRMSRQIWPLLLMLQW